MTLVQTRIYRPLTVAELRHLAAEGTIGPAPFTAYAVTGGLRRQHPGADEEELEYLAFGDAVTTSLGGDVTARVVAAADVDAEIVAAEGRPGQPVTAVQVTGPVSRRQVASFHVADPTGTADDAGAGGGGIPELSWYDATELDVVVDLVT